VRRVFGAGAIVMFAAVAGGAVSAQAIPTAPLHRVTPMTQPAQPAAAGLRVVRTRTVADTPGTARMLHRAASNRSITVTLSFAPQQPSLLARLARRGSGTPGVAIATLRRLFSPPGAVVTWAGRYLARHGFRETAGGILTRSYTGSVYATESAFHTRIYAYQAGGVIFRAPAGPVKLPARIAASVASVSGLDTYPIIRPAARPATSVLSQTAVTSSCAGSNDVQQALGGYQPGDLAAAGAYDFQSLIDANDDARGETLALVEFSTYSHSDVAHYQGCYGTAVPITDVAVNGGTTSMNGAGEVELDEEVAIGAGPMFSHVYTYVAPPSAGFATVLDQMLLDAPSTATTEISISWGGCEAMFEPSDLAASDAEFQLAAAAGISVFAASGDDGSTDCRAFGSNALAVDYPAADPYVTAVGGTTLDTSQSGAARESSWGSPSTASGGGGGGGVSSLFPMPSWQTGTGVIEAGYSSMSRCGQTSRYCRELPDVSLTANPDTGYIIYCTASGDCGSQGWLLIGGTSGAAPLLAAITADANDYALAHGGGRLGFANPFFYGQAGSAMFRDVTLGSNNIVGGSAYPAGTGYDMASGLGSPDGAAFGQALAAYSAAAPSFDDTSLSAAESRSVLGAGASTLLHGVLRDTTTGLPLSQRRIILQGYYSYRGSMYTVHKLLVTDSNGRWAAGLTISTVKSRMFWYAAYPGEEGLRPALSPARQLYVRPVLTTRANLTWTGTRYVVRHGTAFKLYGVSHPAISGRRVWVQYRVYGASRWHTTSIAARVSSTGTYAARIAISTPGRLYLRFSYVGSSSGPWLSAKSPARLFAVT
jgi:hypothetical protein